MSQLPAVYQEAPLDFKVSDEDRDLLDEIHRLKSESQRYRSDTQSQRAMSLEGEWEQGGHRYLGNHWTSVTGSSGLTEGYRVVQFIADDGGLEGVHRSTLNRTGNSIISNVAGETEQPIQIRFVPTESRDRAPTFLSPEGGEKMKAILYDTPEKLIDFAESEMQNYLSDQNAIDEIQRMAEHTIDAHLAKFGFSLDNLIDLDKLIADEDLSEDEDDLGPRFPLSRRELPLVEALVGTVLDPDDLIEVNDRLVAEVAQMVFDNHWGLANGDNKFLWNEFMSNIFGNQPIRFQFHTERPNRWTWSLENTHILNVWLDPTHQDIAESDYFIFDHPMSLKQAVGKYPEHKEKLEHSARDGQLNDREFRLAALHSQTDFQRPMVIVETSWLRWHQVPMTEEEALEDGLADQDEDGNWVLPNGQDTHPPDIDGKAGEGWPDTLGLRQVVTIPSMKIKLDDRRCPYWDIPFAWNLNLPRPDGSPYGQGEPVRLEDISKQINRLISILDNYARYYQFPMRYWPATMLDKLQSLGFEFHARAGANIPIDDDDWRMVMGNGGFNSITQDIPAIPISYVNLLDKLLQEHDRMSGNVQVRQGITPHAGASGKAIDKLITEAAGPLGFKAKFTEAAVERIARLAIDAMTKWMPLDQWHKIVSHYERPVLAKAIERMKLRNWNIQVETIKGKGATRLLQNQEAVDLYAQGAPTRLISRESAQNRLRVPDPSAENIKIERENKAFYGSANPALETEMPGDQVKVAETEDSGAL